MIRKGIYRNPKNYTESKKNWVVNGSEHYTCLVNTQS